jgi:hypothetical protein
MYAALFRSVRALNFCPIGGFQTTSEHGGVQVAGSRWDSIESTIHDLPRENPHAPRMGNVKPFLKNPQAQYVEPKHAA